MDSPSILIHHAAGGPPHKYTEEAVKNGSVCATCAAPITRGVDTGQVNNPTFSNHAEFFKFGTHVCRGCAWMYADPKRTHRNVLCVGEELWWPMISTESATDERPSWMELFGLIADYPPETSATGVLTTDPKPRMWPRCRAATVGSFGLYIHAPDMNISEWREFSLYALPSVSKPIRESLLGGFSKTRIHRGLLGDYAKAKRSMREAMRLERDLQAARDEPEFVPALLVTQVSKEEKADWKESHDGDGERAGDTGGVGAGREARGAAGEDPPRLL